MATEFAGSISLLNRENGYETYPAGVVDRFIAWVDRLPVPSLLFYLHAAGRADRHLQQPGLD